MTQSACDDAHVPERQDPDREVLTSLPRSRPVRRSAKRADRPAADGAARASAKPAAARRPRAAKAAPATTAAKPAAAPRASATPAAAGPKRAAPKRASAPAAGAANATPTDRARPRDTPRRKVPAAGYAAPEGRAGEPSASAGAELVSTTIQAAGELAQIGLTVGRQTLRSMLDRLPKP
jgi:hypothetical protein